MKRTLVFMLSLLVFAACATTATAPGVTGVITQIDGNTVTIAPAGGGQSSTVTLGWGTQVIQPNGMNAKGTSVLAVGMPVKVWLENGTQTAGRIEIGD
jgi:hypothetical protein